MQNEIQKLMQKDMDRRNFLKHVGIGFAAIAGVTTLLKTLSTMSGSQKATGYGSNAYGGSSTASKVSSTRNSKLQG